VVIVEGVAVSLVAVELVALSLVLVESLVEVELWSDTEVSLDRADFDVSGHGDEAERGGEDDAEEEHRMVRAQHAALGEDADLAELAG